MPAAKSPGRPLAIDDCALVQRQAELISAFEFQWTEFAWELERAKNVRAIRNALRPVQASNCVAKFITEQIQKGTSNELRQLRRSLDTLSTRLALAHEEEQAAKTSLETIEQALRHAETDKDMERVHQKRKKLHCDSSMSLRQLQERSAEIQNELSKREAFIAQAGLLDFILSKRYKVTPITLASALAGLPFITWRQSITRCNELTPSITVGLEYLMLQDIRRALEDPPQTADRAVAQVGAYLVHPNRTISQSIRMLKAHWYYLRIAIEEAYSHSLQRAALPFKVHVAYRRRSSIRSFRDQVLEAEERL